MPLIFIFVVGIAVALIRRRLLIAPEDRTGGDAPARLLGWAAGLLAAEREQWGQAMIGELDRLDGQAARGLPRTPDPQEGAWQPTDWLVGHSETSPLNAVQALVSQWTACHPNEITSLQTGQII